MLFDAENGQVEAIVIGGVTLPARGSRGKGVHIQCKNTTEKIICISTGPTSVLPCHVRCSRAIEFVEGIGLALLLR